MKRQYMLSNLIIGVGGFCFGACVCFVFGKISRIHDNNLSREKAAKLYDFYLVLLQWLKNYQLGKKIAIYLKQQGINTVAIYGMKELGECLYDELKGSDICVKYVIDKAADQIFAECKIVTPDSELDEVDMVIVTAIHYYEDIKKNLLNKNVRVVISLSDLLRLTENES